MPGPPCPGLLLITGSDSEKFCRRVGAFRTQLSYEIVAQRFATPARGNAGLTWTVVRSDWPGRSESPRLNDANCRWPG